MKKTFSFIMLAMMMATGAMAQKMVVKTTDKQTVMYDIPNVECVSFVDGYVDLGLPSGTLWATMNVGASSPEEYGDLFAWGETEPKSEYAWTNYFDYDADDASNRYKKYNNNGGLTELLPEDDAAAANWGEGWQMPSMAQFEELIDPSNTTTIWLEQKGVYGRMIIGKNSQYIFLPAAGYCWGTSHNSAGSDGHYWSRSLNASGNGQADGLYFGSGSISSLYSGRGMGFSVRPVVCGAKQTQKILVTKIELNFSSLTLAPDRTKQLTATVEPEDASNKAVTWTSSDASVATVSTDGLVTTVAEATCTITCSAKDGSGVKAECQVKVSSTGFDCSGKINGHPYVDLGLPSGTLWAACNVGSDFPWMKPAAGGQEWDAGCGSPSLVYKDGKLLKYCTQSEYGYNGFTDDLTELLPEDDYATRYLGSEWQTPSKEQFEELINPEYTTVEWTSIGSNGLRITGKNGNSIFLRADGRDFPDGSCYYNNTTGFYWTRSLYTDRPDCAWAFVFEGGDFAFSYWLRHNMFSLRPVLRQ